MKRYLLNEIGALIGFRLIVFVLLIFFVLHGREVQEALPVHMLALLGLYLLSNLLVVYAGKKKWLKKPLWQFGVFLVDTSVVTTVIYRCQGWSSDLYLIYFIVIFMSGIQMKVWFSFLIGTLASIVYGFFVMRSGAGLMDTDILLRFPFFYLVSFYTAFLAHYAKSVGEKIERDYREKISYTEQKAALEKLASRIATELNNPVRIILGFSQWLSTKVGVNQELQRPVSAILREAERCRGLVQNLELLYSGSGGHFEPVDLNTVLYDALDELGLPAPHIPVNVILDPSIPDLPGERKQIYVAVRNILQNAVEAVGERGKISVETLLLDREGALLLEIRIRDSGPGIPEDLRTKVFEPFFSTKERAGAGLGLPVAAAILKRHHGVIAFDDDPEGGSLFVLQFEVQKDGNVPR